VITKRFGLPNVLMDIGFFPHNINRNGSLYFLEKEIHANAGRLHLIVQLLLTHKQNPSISGRVYFFGLVEFGAADSQISSLLVVYQQRRAMSMNIFLQKNGSCGHEPWEKS